MKALLFCLVLLFGCALEVIGNDSDDQKTKEVAESCYKCYDATAKKCEIPETPECKICTKARSYIAEHVGSEKL